jgi:dipeptidyl aminopeptidase/acylaminoacyl peptidase
VDDSSEALADREIGSKEIVRPTMPMILQQAFGGGWSEFLAHSPVSHAASIKAKVLLMHQQNDRHSPPEQMAGMQRAMAAARNPAPGDTIGAGAQFEGYFTPDTRVPVYARMLGFMSQHIGIEEKQSRERSRPR